MAREVPCPTGWLATGGLWAVLSSDLGGRPLGWLLLQQCQGVPLLDGAQLLLLRPLELGGVSDHLDNLCLAFVFQAAFQVLGSALLLLLPPPLLLLLQVPGKGLGQLPLLPFLHLPLPGCAQGLVLNHLGEPLLGAVLPHPPRFGLSLRDYKNLHLLLQFLGRWGLV